MKLSIIIVNYNVQFFLENCLNSVEKAIVNMDAEIIVVDNNSVDGSLEMLANKFPAVKVIANTDNKGFSKANNQAIKKSKGEYILLLNPDTVVKEDTFQRCIDFFEKHYEAGGIGVKMLDGKGNFLPESKRGLPTPKIAFYKIFGLSQLFPKSKKFSHYHLGHLSKDENHEVDVLSGAFMMIRKSALDQIGLLDENFFMYGEDIDISYRIKQAGYKNYYLADTSIIHYKGESTKKSSINYVFVFYRAMAIFAKKHFSNKNAQLFSKLINLAIYIRASFAIISRTIKYFLLPLLDGIVLFTSTFLFTTYYETSIKYASGGEYPEEVESYGIPIMVLIYLVNLFLHGAYIIPTKFSSITKGVLSGSLSLLIIYSLLDENYRFSRAIVLFSVLVVLFILPAFRYIYHWVGLRRFRRNQAQRIAIVGNSEEVNRITSFLRNTLIEPEKIIPVDAGNATNKKQNMFAGKLHQLTDIIEIYQINEIIFCAKDLSSKEIISQMDSITNEEVDFKIAPPESLYIIGSNSIENSGEYYIVGTNALTKPINQRNKRILDLLLSFSFLLLSPIFFWISDYKKTYFSQLFAIARGKISFVGFYQLIDAPDHFLKIKKGALTPLDLHPFEKSRPEVIERLNLEYGKDYNWLKDIEIVVRCLSKIGRPLE